MKIYTERGGFWEVAERCAERNGTETTAYVEEIYGKVQRFIESNDLEDRDELVERIKVACTTKGITMLLGGMSTGKSFIAKNVTEELSRGSSSFVVRTNLREYSNVFDAVSDDLAKKIAFAEAKRPDLDSKIKKILGDLGQSVLAGVVNSAVRKLEATKEIGVIPPAASEAALNTASAVFTALLNETDVDTLKKKKASQLIDRIVNEAKHRKMLPVLIIDEANVLFEFHDTDTRELLRLFVARTKEDHDLSVLLISSDHALPFLFRDHLGLNLRDLDETIFVGELPPNEMRTLLVEKWGLDPELAHYCIGVYGAHVYDTFRALRRHRVEKDEMSAFDVEPLDASMNIIRCLKAEDGKNNPSFRAMKRTVPEIEMSEELAGLKDALRELAASGFVPIDGIDDVKARVLSI